MIAPHDWGKPAATGIRGGYTIATVLVVGDQRVAGYIMQFDGRSDADVFRQAAEWLGEHGNRASLVGVNVYTTRDTGESILTLSFDQ